MLTISYRRENLWNQLVKIIAINKNSQKYWNFLYFLHPRKVVPVFILVSCFPELIYMYRQLPLLGPLFQIINELLHSRQSTWHEQMRQVAYWREINSYRYPTWLIDTNSKDNTFRLIFLKCLKIYILKIFAYSNRNCF